MNKLNLVFCGSGFILLVGYFACLTGAVPPEIQTLMLTVGFPVWGAGFLGWIMYYDYKMEPVLAYYGSWLKNRTLMLYMTKSGRAYLRSDAKYISGVYEIENQKTEELMAFSKNDKGGFKFGETSLELTYDAANMVLRPEFIVAIESLKRAGYSSIDSLQEALVRGEFKPYCDKELGITITSTGKPEKGEVYVPLFKTVNPHEVLEYVLGSATIFKSFTDTKVQMERLRQAKGILGDPNFQGIMLLVVGGCIGLGILKALHVF